MKLYANGLVAVSTDDEHRERRQLGEHRAGARLRGGASDKNERVLENLNLDFSTTASEEQFGEQEKPFCARDGKLSPPEIFLSSEKSCELSEADEWIRLHKAAESDVDRNRESRRLANIFTFRCFFLRSFATLAIIVISYAKEKLFVGGKKCLIVGSQ